MKHMALGDSHHTLYRDVRRDSSNFRFLEIRLNLVNIDVFVDINRSKIEL
jgi:hypothetical protein